MTCTVRIQDAVGQQMVPLVRGTRPAPQQNGGEAFQFAPEEAQHAPVASWNCPAVQLLPKEKCYNLLSVIKTYHKCKGYS